ncbi:MAG: DUF1565 domain-containing protein [Candidatus Aminicenantes bacterium]|nr:DUF1565 domain-containing protein [Candidatus Aminicenantes bacterium]
MRSVRSAVPLSGCALFLALFAAGCREAAPTLPDTPSVSSAISASRISLEIFVDAATGDDAAGNGSAAFPFRTISRGLQAGSSGMTVTVRPGIYSPATGESFPLRLKDGLTLRGAAAETVTIDGAGAAVVLEDAPQARIEQLTVRGGGQAGMVLGFSSTAALCALRQNFRGVVCESSASVEDCLIENNSDTGIYIRGSAAPAVRRNVIRGNGGEGVECREDSAPLLRGNDIRENQKHGVVCTDSASPLLQENTITQNVLPEVYVLFGARPTLSGNIIRDNARYNIDDARSPGQGEISALGNTWNDPQPSGTISGPADSRPNYFIKEAGNSIRFSGGAAAVRRRRLS